MGRRAAQHAILRWRPRLRSVVQRRVSLPWPRRRQSDLGNELRKGFRRQISRLQSQLRHRDGIVDGDAVVLPVGNPDGATLVCFDKRSGKVLWKSGVDEAAYSSPIIATLAGARQIVYLSADSLAGYDPKNGKILWRVPLKTDAKRHACSPVIIGDTVTVNSHTFGTICFKIVMESRYSKW